jgi:hypothetical protein
MFCPKLLKMGFKRDRKKAPRGTLDPSEPLYWILLETPLHKSSRSIGGSGIKAINLESVI